MINFNVYEENKSVSTAEEHSSASLDERKISDLGQQIIGKQDSFSPIKLTLKIKKQIEPTKCAVLKCSDGELKVSMHYLNGCDYFKGKMQTYDLTQFPVRVVKDLINILAGNVSENKKEIESHLWMFCLSKYLQLNDLKKATLNLLASLIRLDINHLITSFCFYLKITMESSFLNHDKLFFRELTTILINSLLSKRVDSQAASILTEEIEQKLIIWEFLDEETQTLIGTCLSSECFVSDQASLGIEILQSVARQGWALGQYSLGRCYFHGIGVETDLVKAVNFYRLAAERNLPRAQCDLGYCYENSIIVNKDLVEAVKLYQMAADQGDAAGQFYLAQCYSRGIGVEKDVLKGVNFYRLAAEQNFPRAQTFLGLSYEHGVVVNKDLVEAVKLYQMAADQGCTLGQFYLAQCYSRGIGVERDLVKAVNFFRLAAEQNFPRAQTFLGLCYEYGAGVKKDLVEAVKLYQMAVEQGDAAGQFCLARFYHQGIGVKQNLEKALTLYQVAANKGLPIALFTLAQIYEEGIYLKKDLSKAIELYKSAANKGHTRSQLALSRYGELGSSLEQNVAEKDLEMDLLFIH